MPPLSKDATQQIVLQKSSQASGTDTRPPGTLEWLAEWSAEHRALFLPTGALDYPTAGATDSNPPPGRVRLFFDEIASTFKFRDDLGAEFGFGGGATNFLALTDTPGSYAGQAGLVARVNVGETGLEFAAVSGGVTDHGALTGLADDDHLQYLLLAGRAGGQVAIGGTAVSEELQLRGSTDAALGRVRVQSPLEIDNVLAGDTTALRYRPTFTTSAAYVGGFAITSPTITVGPGGGVFIPTAFGDSSVIRINAALVFAVYTYANVAAVIQNVGNFNLLNASVMNVGLTHERVTAGTSTGSITGFNFSPMTRATIASAIMNKGTQTALSLAPVFSTVAGSQVSLGTITGLLGNNPSVGLFAPQAGTQTMTSYVLVDMVNVVFGGNVLKAALRSAQAAATNAYFLLQTGSAQSQFLGQVSIAADNVGLNLGAGNNVLLNWNGTGLEFDPVVGDDLRFTFGLNTHTITSPAFLTGSDLLLAFDQVRFPRRALFQGVTNRPPISQTLVADVNNYQGQGASIFQRGVVRVTAAANRTITGFDVAISQTSDELFVLNVGTVGNVTLAHQDVLSLAANRMISPTGANLVLAPNQSAHLWYDLSTARWRIILTTGT